MIGALLQQQQQQQKVSTEAIDATVNLDGAKRSNYDPDEMMEEQRERLLRKRFNSAFKDFASKVQYLRIGACRIQPYVLCHAL